MHFGFLNDRITVIVELSLSWVFRHLIFNVVCLCLERQSLSMVILWSGRLDLDCLVKILSRLIEHIQIEVDITAVVENVRVSRIHLDSFVEVIQGLFIFTKMIES